MDEAPLMSTPRPYRPRYRCRRLIVAIVLLALGTPTPLLPASAPAKSMSLISRLRRLIGYNPPQAVGGERAPGVQQVCLISPRLTPDGRGGWLALVALDQPRFLFSGGLSEWKLEDADRNVLAGKRAALHQPITGAIPWPVAPLKRGEHYTLSLRPSGAGGLQYVSYTILAAPAAQQARAQALLASDRDRVEVVDELVRQGEGSLALELAFAPVSRPSPGLSELQSQLMQQDCPEAPLKKQSAPST